MKIKTKPEAATLLRFKTHTIAATVAMMLLLPVASQGGGVVANCTEANLRAAMAGGGLVTFACDGTITLAGTITNSADTVLDATGHQIAISGGTAVRVFYVNSNTTMALVNLSIVDGSSEAGGGIFNHGWVSLKDCSFGGNNVVGAAGIDGSTLPPKTPTPGSKACGGAVYNAGTLEANFCTFSRNSASGGEGGAGRNGQLFPGPGGGPGCEGGEALGGAIFNSGSVSVNASAFVGNQVMGGDGGTGGSGGPGTSGGTSGGAGGFGADTAGAALFNSNGVVRLVNCAVISNHCAGGSGGFGGRGGDAATGLAGSGGAGGRGGSASGAILAGTLSNLTNCTVAFNSANGGPGGPGGAGGTSSDIPGQPGGTGAGGVARGGGLNSLGSGLINTLLATNMPGGNCYGTISDAGHNLSSDASCAFTNVGSLNNTDPKLGPLAGNGGPMLTMALLAGSPAIDAGDNIAAPSTDQRGISRPFGLAADIGAYEYAARLRIDRVQGDEIAIQLCDGNPGQMCRLLTSTNHSDWQCVATNQIGADGTVLFQDSCAAGETQRFFRVALP